MPQVFTDRNAAYEAASCRLVEWGFPRLEGETHRNHFRAYDAMMRSGDPRHDLRDHTVSFDSRIHLWVQYPPEPRLAQLVVLSTCHLMSKTASKAESSEGHPDLDSIHYGYFCRAYQDPDDIDTLSEDLAAVCRYVAAIHPNVEWIKFDVDGAVVEDLPTYDW